jgi:CRP-like cAMP-binding protein
MSDFDNATLERLFGLQPMRKLARDEPLFRQGDPATAVFLISRGRLRMIRHLASGDRITIHTGRSGEFFAEGSLFSDVYQCDAIAAEPTRVRACGKADMLAAIQAPLSRIRRVRCGNREFARRPFHPGAWIGAPSRASRASAKMTVGTLGNAL